MVKIIDIGRWMNRKIIKISPTENIIKAAKLMSDKHVGCLVVNKKKPVGILTQTDVIKRVVSKGMDLNKTLVKDVMSRKVLTAPLNSTIMTVSATMRKKKIKHMLIKDKGNIVGIITSTDILRIMGGA